MRKIINILVTVAFAIASVVFCFMVRCKIDIILIAVAFVAVIAGATVSIIQEKNLKKYEDKGFSLEDR